MPNPTLEDAIKEAYAIAPTQKTLVHTLEVRQEAVQTTVYLVQSRRQIIAKDETGVNRTFEPCGFQFTLPPVTEEGYQFLNVAIDNINRRVTTFVEIAKSSPVPVQLIYRPFLSDDLLGGPQMNPPLRLYLKDVSVTAMQVTGRATFLDLVNKIFPSELYTRDRFPTL